MPLASIVYACEDTHTVAVDIMTLVGAVIVAVTLVVVTVVVLLPVCELSCT